MYDFLGICLALAVLLTVNAIVSLLVTGCWRLAASFTKGLNAATRAQLIFVLQTFPAMAALLIVAVFLVPSYLAFEPHQTNEIVSFKLGLFALFSAAGITLAFWRGLAAWLATKRLADNWQKHSKCLQLKEVLIPVYEINHPFPVVAVVGVLHPKLFVAAQIFDSLNQEELDAVIAHETAHIAARDNLKHWLTRICRDVLMILPSDRSLDREWAEAIELAADEEAVSRKNGATALDLAQALIKIARLVPIGVRPTMPAGSFLIGGEIESGDALARRVGRLMQLADKSPNKDRRDWFSSRVAGIFLGLLFLMMVLVVTTSDALTATHIGIERVVAFLS